MRPGTPAGFGFPSSLPPPGWARVFLHLEGHVEEAQILDKDREEMRQGQQPRSQQLVRQCDVVDRRTHLSQAEPAQASLPGGRLGDDLAPRVKGASFGAPADGWTHNPGRRQTL